MAFAVGGYDHKVWSTHLAPARLGPSLTGAEPVPRRGITVPCFVNLAQSR
jgi:hypothetical protein